MLKFVIKLGNVADHTNSNINREDSVLFKDNMNDVKNVMGKLAEIKKNAEQIIS